MELKGEFELTMVAEPRTVKLARNLLVDFCRANYISEQLIDDLKVALSEACTNVVRHAYDNKPGPVKVKIDLLADDLILSVTDFGFGFSQLELKSKTDELTPGGLGIFIIKQLADAVDYRSRPKGTEVRLLKHLHGAENANLTLSYDAESAAGLPQDDHLSEFVSNPHREGQAPAR